MALELCISVGISDSCMSGVRNFGTLTGTTPRSLRVEMERLFGPIYTMCPYVTCVDIKMHLDYLIGMGN